MRGAQRLRSRTTHLCMSTKQDMSQIPFHLVLCLSRLSRHSVVAPTLAAPLLIDIRRSTVVPGTREDIVTKPDEMRSWTHQGWHEVLDIVLSLSISFYIYIYICVYIRTCTVCLRKWTSMSSRRNELWWVRFNVACPPAWRYLVRILGCALSSVPSNF